MNRKRTIKGQKRLAAIESGKACQERQVPSQSSLHTHHMISLSLTTTTLSLTTATVSLTTTTLTLTTTTLTLTLVS